MRHEARLRRGERGPAQSPRERMWVGANQESRQYISLAALASVLEPGAAVVVRALSRRTTAPSCPSLQPSKPRSGFVSRLLFPILCFCTHAFSRGGALPPLYTSLTNNNNLTRFTFRSGHWSPRPPTGMRFQLRAQTPLTQHPPHPHSHAFSPYSHLPRSPAPIGRPLYLPQLLRPHVRRTWRPPHAWQGLTS